MAAFVLSLIVLAAPGWASEKYRDNFNETDQPYDTKYSGLFVTDCAKRIGSRSPGMDFWCEHASLCNWG